jgi:ACT domain-containing protein
VSHLLRIALPDVPGSLGAVASALGAVGVNIDAIEIVEHRGDGVAVDDFFIRLLPGVMPDVAVSSVTQLDGVDVLWVSRYPTAGNLYLDLEAVELIAQQPARAQEVLTELLPRTFRADWAMVAVRQRGEVYATSRTPAAPELVDACRDWFPLREVRRLDAPSTWGGSTLLGAAPLGSPDVIIVFGRHGGPQILDSELARLAHLATLAASIGHPVPQE